MNRDPFSAASAYLDDALTPAERSAVEDDPMTLAEVERLRALRATLADVEPPEGVVRERAISAALEIFEGAGDVVPTSPTGRPTTMPAPSRRGLAMWLAPAAALVAIVAAGVVLLDRTGSDDSTSDATATLEAPAAGATEERSAGDAPAEALQESADDGGDVQSDAADELAAAEVIETVEGPAGLAEYVRTALARLDEGAAPVDTQCDVDGIVLGLVEYRVDAAAQAPPAVLAFVVVDNDRTTARAVDAESCEPLPDARIDIAN